jgi:glycosyltransferase involved in cell wall biosynthesis
VVICDSTATFNDAVRLLKCTTQTIEVVPIAPNRIFHRRTEAETRLAFTRRNLGLLSNFFVHVGGTQWYKNRLGVLNIFAALREVETFARHDLIFVGKSLTQDIIDAVNALGLSDCVLSLETVDDDLLENLYSSATALLFPSFAEGFGWPIVEAQLCGCPVITSSSPPMSEVAGPESAILLDLAFPETHVRMICEGLRNKDYLVERGFENAARFDEKEMMSTYLKMYEKVISLQDSVSPLFGATRKE